MTILVMGRFTITYRANGQYYFNLKGNNGEVILSSEGYTSKIGCLKGVESVKSNAAYDSRFDRLKSSNGKFYFNLRASNGEILGTSQMYSTESARNSGINSVKTVAPTAVVSETTT